MASNNSTNVGHALNYLKTWGHNDVQRTTQSHRLKRNEQAQKIASQYYDFASDMYEVGWSSHFHFARFRKGETIDQGLKRHEHFMAMMTEMKPGMKVLELGSGVGAPAREIASFAGVHVTCVNLNKYQIGRSKDMDRQFGTEDMIDYVDADFMKMPFDDNTFDAVYAFEALCYAPSLEGVYSEALRVLKPGGVFGTYEYIMSSKYDDTILEHQEIRSRIESGVGCCNLTTPEHAFESMKRAGFEDVWHQDNVEPSPQYPIPWWWALNGDTGYATTLHDRFLAFMMKEWVFKIHLSSMKVLSFIGIAPKGVCEAMETVSMGVFAMRDGGKIGIFTSQELLIGRKPGQREKPKNLKMKW